MMWTMLACCSDTAGISQARSVVQKFLQSCELRMGAAHRAYAERQLRPNTYAYTHERATVATAYRNSYAPNEIFLYRMFSCCIHIELTLHYAQEHG